MRLPRTYGFWLIALATLGTIGCATMGPPPSVEPLMPRRGITPRSYKMKLAVFNLQDPTGSGGKLSESVAEVLHISLFETNRFELMQRAELRGIDPGDTKRIQEQYRDRLDALVVGSITHFDTVKKTVALNVNVMNPYGTTMAAKHFVVKYSGNINVDADRDDIDRIAEWIERSFPKLATGEVISRSSDRITVNLGTDSGVQVGMWMLVASRGDIVRDPQTGEFLGSDIYVGEVYVVAINPATCDARLVRNVNKRIPQIKVGDKVVFK